MNIFLDIETIPEQPEIEAKKLIAKTIEAPAQMKKPETIADWHNGAGKYAGEKDKAIDAEYRKGSFDGGRGQICSIAFSDGNTMENIVDVSGESVMIDVVFRKIEKLLAKPAHHTKPMFVGHYIQFDLKFLWQRCVVLGIKPPFDLPFNGRHGQHFYDNMQAWCGYKDRISQDNLAKALSVERRETDIEGSKVWDAYKAGRVQDIGDYNVIDVETVISIYKKINFQ